MPPKKDLILEALEEAQVEVSFRLEDVKNNPSFADKPSPKAPTDFIEKSIEKTLNKIKSAIETRKNELGKIKD